MKKVVLGALSALLVSAFLTFAVAGLEAKSLPETLQARNSITGFVFGDGRRPLPDVYVELLDDMGSTLSRAKTSGSGMFTFRGLPDGIFQVRVLPYGSNYQGDQRRVPLVAVSARRGSGSIAEHVDFYLRPKPTEQNPLAAPAVVFAQEIPEDARKLYDEGVKLLEDKNAEAAYEKLKGAIEVFPKYYMALERLGVEYVKGGHFAPAAVLLTQAVEVNPEGFASRFGLGIAHFRLNRFIDSVSSLKLAAQMRRDSMHVHLWLGIALHASGDFDGAEKALRRADKLSNGDSADVHWQLARVLKDKGQYGESADELELVLKLKPDAPESASIRETVKRLREKARNGS